MAMQQEKHVSALKEINAYRETTGTPAGILHGGIKR